MTSLYDIIEKQNGYGHLSTGIKSLNDDMEDIWGPGIFDFQAVPNCSGMYQVISQLVVSHLKEDLKHSVVIIDTLNRFPWEYVTLHESFQYEWLDTRLKSYTIDSVTKLAVIIERMTNSCDAKTLFIINEFYELIESYKLELSASYEQTLLKMRILQNEAIVTTLERQKAEGFVPDIPHVPNKSSLLRENPNLKFTSHVTFILNLLSKFAYNTDSVVILSGYLATQYKKILHRNTSTDLYSSQSNIPSSASSDTSFRSTSQEPSLSFTGKIVLSPALNGVSSRTDLKSSSLSSTFESITSLSLKFYKDWYHKTSHFMNNFQQMGSNIPLKLHQAQLKSVFSVEVFKPQKAYTSTYYFDYDNGYYYDGEDGEPDFKVHERLKGCIKLIDLGSQNSFSIAPLNIRNVISTDTVITNEQGRSNLVNSAPTLSVQDLGDTDYELSDDDQLPNVTTLESQIP